MKEIKKELVDLINKYENTFFIQKNNLKINKKILYKYINEIIDESINYGNLHFNITINFQEDISLEDDREVSILINNLTELIYKNIQLVSFIAIVPELNENKKLHLHAFLAVKTFIGPNDYLYQNIENLIMNNYEIDVEVKKLKTPIDIKNGFKYLLKDCIYNIEYLHVRYLEPMHYIFGNLIEYINIVCDLKTPIYIYDKQIEQDDIIKGIIVDKEESSIKESTVIYFWLYYLTLNDIYVFQNELFKKKKNSLISYIK